MVKLETITTLLEKAAPVCYASEWDNVGLMIGSSDCNIENVMVCLDVTPDVVEQAIKCNCKLIVSHHPLFFKGISIIDYSTPKGNMIKNIIQNNIAVYSCHTNMDSANGGINSVLAEEFGLSDIEILEPNNTYPEAGIGRLGYLRNKISFAELCGLTKKILKCDCLKTVCSNDKPIKKLCVASGSCGDLIELAASKGADAIITADVKYHEALDAYDSGITVIDAGHYPTEIIVCDIFKRILNDLDIKLFTAESNDVFKFI